ncbi:MAG: DedA family protein [Rhodospirillales bacterium]|nr:DedA family protein [Rhodospirillales bacterium]
MLQRFYDWTLALSRTKHAPAVMAAVSFADASFCPLMPHPLLALLVMARPDRAYWYATLCTVTSVAGAFLGYAIGHLLYETLGLWLVQTMHYEAHMEKFQAMFAEWGFWLIVGKGLTPIPFKIVTIGAGVAGYGLIPFTIASVLARAMNFYAIAWVLKHQGGRIDALVRRYGTQIGWAISLAIVALVVWWFALR